MLFVVALRTIAVSDIRWAQGATPVWPVAWAVYWVAVRRYGGTSPRVAVVTTHVALAYEPYVLVLPTAAALAGERDARRPGAHRRWLGASAVLVLLVVRQHVVSVESRAPLVRLEATERLLRHQATHDHLTGLPGRVVLWSVSSRPRPSGDVGAPGRRGLRGPATTSRGWTTPTGMRRGTRCWWRSPTA